MQTSLPQSHARFPFTRILGQGAHLRVLRALFASETPLSAPDIAERAGLTPQGTRLSLDALVSWGVIVQLGSRRSRLFLLSQAYPLTAAIRALFTAENAAWEKLMLGLRRGLAKDKAVSSAWLRGPLASGTDQPGERLSLVLIVSQAQTDDAAAHARQVLAECAYPDPDACEILALGIDALMALSTDAHRWNELAGNVLSLKGAEPASLLKQRARPLQQGLF